MNCIIPNSLKCVSALAIPFLLLAGCYDSGEARTEIAQSIEVPKSEVPPAQKLNTKERMGLSGSSAAKANPAAAPSQAGGETLNAGFAWTLPENWEDRGATSMRLANVGPAGQADAECAFSTLSGDGGGLAANLNRWRKQMGLADYTQEEIDALPRKPLLGQEAIYTLMDGSYGGMGGQDVKDSWRMLGLTLIHEGTAYFVKMTGPQAVLAVEEPQFLAFAESIHTHEAGDDSHAHHAHESSAPALSQDGATALPDGHPPIPAATDATSLPDGHPPITGAADATTLPDGHPPIPGAAASTALPDGHPPIPQGVTLPMPGTSTVSASSFQWDAPEAWVQAADRPMREVTFTIDGAECYIALLGGMAGGVEANINRWVMQMGQEALSPEALKALPTITVLGKQSPLVETEGEFTGMSGGTVPDQKLLGVVCPLDTQTLFIKMTGPKDVVTAQASNFVAFCESIRN